MYNQKLHSFLGLASRAGKIVSGDDSTLLDIKKKKVFLVIVAEDASDNTKKLFKNKCTSKEIEYIFVSSKIELGQSIGKHYRAVIGIKDRNFAKKIKEIIKLETK